MNAIRILLAVSVVFALTAVAGAHEPPGVTYFAFQFPVHALPVVDGDLSDWDMVPEAYQITLSEDFEETVRGIGTDFDLEDINIRAILGWNEETNRIYSMVEVVDDFLHNKRENPSGMIICKDDHSNRQEECKQVHVPDKFPPVKKSSRNSQEKGITGHFQVVCVREWITVIHHTKQGLAAEKKCKNESSP